MPTCPSSGSAWTEAAVHSGSSSQYAPTAPLVPPAVASDGPQFVLSKWAFPDFTIQADYLFFCTICPANRPFKNLSEWKRHERGHEISYICMLGGPRKLTRLGLVCVVCGSPGPDEKHLEAHKVNPCAEQTPASFSCKRRDQMVTHLNKYHRVYDVHQGQAIANEWKATSGKRAWSCCFCIKLFTNHEDRLKHISMEHFKPHQKSNHRTATNVIKGLLLQPGVAAAWDCVLAKSYPWTLPNIHWVNGTIGDLQLMLEKGPSASQSPESLAEAALAAAQVNWDTSGPDGSTLPMASHSVVIQRPHHTSQLTPCPFAQSWDTSYSSTVPEAAPEPFEAHDTSGFWSEAHVADGPKADIDPLNSLRRLPRQASDNLEHAIDDVTVSSIMDSRVLNMIEDHNLLTPLRVKHTWDSQKIFTNFRTTD